MPPLLPMPRFAPRCCPASSLFGDGAYIHAKALLAQVLLERAFDRIDRDAATRSSRGHGPTPGRSRGSR